MVSLQSPHSPSRRATMPEPENPLTPQKRKHLEALQTYDFTTAGERHMLEKRAKPEIQNFMADIELHLETPLPSEWQRCLDIQSGKIDFYNTKTQARTSTDPRTAAAANPDRPNTSHRDHDHDHDRHEHDYNHMSLDLELNLTTSESPSAHRHSNHHNKFINLAKAKTEKSGAPAWLALETDQRQEMVATVCARCHMLVMLCRSSPSCPNCKFVHGQPEKSPSTTSFVQVKL